MSKSRFLLVAAGCLLLSSCARPLNTSTQITDQQTNTHQSSRVDSTATERSYTERVRQTKVQVGSDSVDFELQLETLPTGQAAPTGQAQPTGQLKPATYTSRGRRASVQLKVDATGKVTGRCSCDAEKATILSLDRELTLAKAQLSQRADTTRHVRLVRDTRRIAVPTPYTAWYDWLARIVAVGLSLLLLIMYLVHRFRSKSDG